MTPAERRDPSLINGSRRMRIAQGSGITTQDVNALLKQFKMVQQMMRSARQGQDAQAPRRHGSRRLTATGRSAPFGHRIRCHGTRATLPDPCDPDERNAGVAVKIRLMRVGKKKQPTYRVVVADGRSPRDGRFIEIIGQYAPREEPSGVEIDAESALGVAAQGRAAHRAGAEAARRHRRVGAVRGRARQARGHEALAARLRHRQGRARA